MIVRLCGAALLAMMCSLALADAAQPFVGKWKVQWQVDRASYTAQMELTATGGSWQTATSRRSNPCFGRKVPLQHDLASADKLELTLKFSEVIADCKDARVRLQLNDQGEVVGTRSGYELKLERE